MQRHFKVCVGFLYFNFSHTGDKEERCYVTGRLDGTAKYYYTSGAVETRIYENGVLQVHNNNPDIFPHFLKTILTSTGSSR